MRTVELANLERDIAVLKLSSGLLLNEDGVGIDPEAVEDCADHIAEVNEQFHPLIVLGAAVGAGKAYLRDMGEPYEDEDLQVLASYGTPEVSVAVKSALRQRNIKSGQVLANHEQLYAGSTLMQAILYGVVEANNAYHINENDQENLFELKLLKKEDETRYNDNDQENLFELQRKRNEARKSREKPLGIDNDPLAARLTIATIAELKAQGLSEELACHLVMFTEVGGFLDNNKQVQAEISATDREEVYRQCDGVRDGGSGGMEVKVKACFDAFDAGAKTVHIASPDQNWLNVVNDSGEAGKVTKVVQ